jgi:hypothetical protein
MGQRNQIRKEIMGLPDGGSAMTADDVAENILAAQYGWDLLRRFTRHHNAIVNGLPGTEEIPFDTTNILCEPLYNRDDIHTWLARKSAATR